jgi:hypothetical protein
MSYNSTLQQIKTLAKQQKHEEALQLTLLLRKKYPTDPTLHRLINKLKKNIRTQELGSRGGFIKGALKTIKAFRKDKNFASAIQASKELLEIDPQNRKAEKLLNKSKIDLIDQKLHDPIRKQYLENEEYQKLYFFYQKLKKVFPNYQKLNAMIKETERQMIIQDRATKKTFSDESLNKIKNLFGEGKYEKVIAAAEDLILYTHYGSKESSDLLKKAKKANEKEIEDKMLEYMLNQQPILEASFKSGSEPMIKI